MKIMKYLTIGFIIFSLAGCNKETVTPYDEIIDVSKDYKVEHILGDEVPSFEDTYSLELSNGDYVNVTSDNIDLSDVDFNAPGMYDVVITYTTRNSEKTYTLNVQVVDDEAPVITWNDIDSVTCFSEHTDFDSFVSISDNYDIKSVNYILYNPSGEAVEEAYISGEYTLRVTARDYGANKEVLEHTVEVLGFLKPTENYLDQSFHHFSFDLDSLIKTIEGGQVTINYASILEDGYLLGGRSINGHLSAVAKYNDTFLSKNWVYQLDDDEDVVYLHELDNHSILVFSYDSTNYTLKQTTLDQDGIYISEETTILPDDTMWLRNLQYINDTLYLIIHTTTTTTLYSFDASLNATIIDTSDYTDDYTTSELQSYQVFEDEIFYMFYLTSATDTTYRLVKETTDTSVIEASIFDLEDLYMNFTIYNNSIYALTNNTIHKYSLDFTLQDEITFDCSFLNDMEVIDNLMVVTGAIDPFCSYLPEIYQDNEEAQGIATTIIDLDTFRILAMNSDVGLFSNPTVVSNYQEFLIYGTYHGPINSETPDNLEYVFQLPKGNYYTEFSMGSDVQVSASNTTFDFTEEVTLIIEGNDVTLTQDTSFIDWDETGYQYVIFTFNYNDTEYWFHQEIEIID